MSTYSNRLQPALQNLLQRVRFFHPRSSCMTHIGGHFRWTKITRKASEVAENLQLYWVVWFFHPRLSCTTTHISADVQRITLNASCSCMTMSDGRTKQLDIFCRITMGAARHGQGGARAPSWKWANGYLLLLQIVR